MTNLMPDERVLSAQIVILFCAVILTFVTAVPTASAQTTELSDAMDEWFRGERNEGFVFIGSGAASVAGGIYLLTRDEPFARGAGYATIGAGALMLTSVGFYVASLGPAYRGRSAQLAANPDAFLVEETERIDAIAKRFVVYRWVEISMIAVGAGLVTWGALDDRPVVAGIGTGIIGEFALALVLDYFAERRAHRYLDILRSQH